MTDIPPHVDDEETLHRLLNPRGHAVQNGQIHHMAFFSSTDPHRISVDRERYRTIPQSLDGREHCGVAALRTGHVRELEVTPYPSLGVVGLPEQGNDAHAEIQAEPGIPPKTFKTKICAKLRDIARIVMMPPGAPGP